MSSSNASPSSNPPPPPPPPTTTTTGTFNNSAHSLPPPPPYTTNPSLSLPSSSLVQAQSLQLVPNNNSSSIGSSRPRWDTPRAWFDHVRHQQLSKMTPQQRSELHRAAERQRNLSVNAMQMKSVELQCRDVDRRSKKALSYSKASPAVSSHEMQLMTDRQAQHETAWNSPERLALVLREQEAMEEMEDAMEQPAPPPPPPPEEEAVRTMLTAPQQQREGQRLPHRPPTHHPQFVPPPQQQTTTNPDDISAALAELRNEPPTDDERATKFLIFEKYSERIPALRAALDDAAKTAVTQLPPGLPQEGIKQLVQSLDKAENRGIYDQSRCWFVHDMMVQASKNCQLMRSLSITIQGRLNFAAANTQTSCPICLEDYALPGGQGEGGVSSPNTPPLPQQGGGPLPVPPNTAKPKMLSCCHTVCESCWAQWLALRGTHGAFCPLCKHQEFVELLAQSD